MVKNVTDAEAKEIIEKENYAIIDFYADWCGPCRFVSPIIDRLAEKYDNVSVLKVNVDENNVLATEHSIRGIPTVLFFKNGNLVDRLVGSAKEEDYDSKIKEMI